MNERTYLQESIRAVKMAQEFPSHAEYWDGYRCGLRRAQFGAGCGTDADHQRWLGMADSIYEIEAAFGRGYRDGLAV